MTRMKNRPKGSRAIGSGDQNSFIVESFRGKKALTDNINNIITKALTC